MNRLDERLKERARREDCPVPQGFDGRMDAMSDVICRQNNCMVGRHFHDRFRRGGNHMVHIIKIFHAAFF